MCCGAVDTKRTPDSTVALLIHRLRCLTLITANYYMSSSLVVSGMEVTRGMRIGVIGSQQTSNIHLHYQVGLTPFYGPFVGVPR